MERATHVSRWQREGKLHENYNVFKREIDHNAKDIVGWKGTRESLAARVSLHNVLTAIEKIGRATLVAGLHAATRNTAVAAYGRDNNWGGGRRGSHRGGLLLLELLI
ncbi:hypothetical protein OPV22_010714 [Ensete ventricosum]|uniref:Uncharacterized protein n=1 Tax=Ensete ventricosum TaxID=4639 RepID=A0AAV8RLY4_ENSVE|nr:hypothetical protein OPV22_010714 [Ensete ventricosum]